MTDLSQTIAPKSDQLNADDLIAGPMTIRITKVSANPAAPDQPISMYYDGDNGKPYKPCKSMRRVLVNAWGSDGNKYPGRSLTLYRDDAVKFGGIEVGGIRISHMTDLQKPLTMALTATRASRKPYTVLPLRIADGGYAEAEAAARKGMAALEAHWKSLPKQAQAALKPRLDELKQIAAASAAVPGSGEAAGADVSPDAAPAATPEPWGVADWYQAGSDAKANSGPRKLPEGIPNDLAVQDAWLAGYDETGVDAPAAETATA